MKHKICSLREQLAAVIECEALTSEKVINISHMLDELIVEYTKESDGKFDKLNIDKAQP